MENSCSEGEEHATVTFQRQGTPNNKHDEANRIENEGRKTYTSRN